MENRDLTKQILDIVQELHGQNFDMDTDLRDQGLDSLDIVELVMKIEKEFNIAITDDEVISAKSIKDISELVDSKLN